MNRAVSLSLLALVALGGCTFGQGQDAQVDPRKQVACRDRVNQIYDTRARDQIFSANSSMNSPLSGNYQSGVSSRGLAEQYKYGRMETDCEHDTGDAAAPPSALPLLKGP